MPDKDLDVIVIGAGFAGLRALHTLRGMGLDVVVLEASGGIGGVWNWNRYPGARCDVEGYDYSYSFSEELDQEWRWSERYAAQPEILSYLEHAADKFGLRRDIRLGEQMTRAEFDETGEIWTVSTEAGHRWRARFLIMATGQLSATKLPDIPGRDSFAGEVFLTAQWPHEPVDLAGKRVGVIGTGSSGVQLVTATAPEGARLTVFQRTPNFVVPRANAPITDAEDAAVKARYPERRERLRWTPRGLNFTPNKESALEVTPEEREEQYEDAWDNGLGFGFTLTYPDILLDELANDTAADFIRGKISQKVDDPETLESLTPRDYPFGAKRPPVDSDYFDTFNRDNVELVDIRENPIEEITPTGVSTSAGEHELDVIVFATGFDASTNGRLRDVGRIDEDDYITLAGREKESARCGGEQVLPKETEDVLTAHPAVAQAHVVPVPDDRMGEVGVAWIGLHEGASADPDELIAVCAERLARFKVPRHLLFTTANELPTTASGRPRKFLLAERAAKELGAAPAQ